MPTAQNTTLKPVTIDDPVNTRIKFELVKVTPKMAVEWLGDNHGNRNQRPRKIAAYSRDIRNGDWMTTGESIKFDYNGRLIDGQHRLEAVADTGIPIMSLVVWGLDPRVQRVLDTNAKRSAADALRFAGVQASQKDIAAVARVAVAYESGRLRTAFDNVTADLTNSETIEWADRNPEVESAIALARRVARPLGATPAGIGYAVLVLERIDGVAAVEFFMAMADKRTNGVGDPRKAALDAFDAIRRHGRAPSAAESLNIIFRAWNAWRDKRSLKIIRSAAASASSGVAAVQIPGAVS